jgi:hypothetical protein
MMNDESAATPDAVKEIINVMKKLNECLEAEYENYLEGGPEGHLAGTVIDQITGLCRLFNEAVLGGRPLPRSNNELRAKLREIVPAPLPD